MSRNVVLICLDSVRKDYFDKYAPRLAAMADVSFPQCRAASSWSVPSHASMISGLLPHQHGIHTHNRDFSTLDPNRTLFADLPSEYHSAGISANVYAGPAYGFDEFFDTFVDAPKYQYFADGMNATRYLHESGRDGVRLYLGFLRAALGHEHPIKSVANGVAAQVKRTAMGSPVPDPMDDGATLIRRQALRLVEAADSPLFLFVNFMEAHAPFSPTIKLDRTHYSAPSSWTSTSTDYWNVVTAPKRHADYLERLRELYAANIVYLDRTVSGLIEDMLRDADSETTVIVTSDHGENLGYSSEDGLLEHKSSLSESLLHVPLAVVNPPHDYEGDDTAFVSHLALPDLVRGFVDGEFPDGSSERVVAEHVGMSPGPEPPDDYEHWDRLMRCAYEEGRKVVWDSLGTRTAYRLDPTRPCWQAAIDGDVSVPAWAETRFDVDSREYKQRALERASTDDVDAETKRRLADLGYV